MRFLLLAMFLIAAAAAEPAQLAAPAPMSPQAKAAANRDLAYVQKVREADAIEASAAKMRRDAEEARKLSAKQMEHARNDWRAFCKRAAAEGVGYDPEGAISETLIVLPRPPHGNNRGSMEGVLEAKKTAAKAVDCDGVAQQKAAAAIAARAAAEAMPHGAAAAPQVADAPVSQPAVATAPAVPAATSELAKAWDADKARLTTPDRDAKWLGCATMPPLVGGATPQVAAINGAVAAFNAALGAHDAAAMAKVMESAANRALFAAYEQALTTSP